MHLQKRAEENRRLGNVPSASEMDEDSEGEGRNKSNEKVEKTSSDRVFGGKQLEINSEEV